MEMQDTFMVTPTVIHRSPTAVATLEDLADRTLAVLDIPAKDGGRALLVFMNPEQAEAFRTQIGSYSEEEGFRFSSVDPDGLRAIVETWRFERIALRGPEPDTISELDAQVFIGALEEAADPEEARPRGDSGQP